MQISQLIFNICLNNLKVDKKEMDFFCTIENKMQIKHFRIK
jgi:hypothetical protein